VVDLTLYPVESTAFGRQGPEVQSQSREPDQTDVDRVFADFVPMQLECLRNYTTLLPHVAEMTQAFQKEDIKIGSTTGFVRSMVDILEADAKEQSYVPDASVAGDEVENGARPQPFMVYRNLDLMVVHPIQSIVKVGDTVSGVGEALEAGCWGGGGYCSLQQLHGYR
jgi:phosphonoacetaldehyde hydrolase